MKRLDIPFNIKLLLLSNEKLAYMGQVKSLSIYDGATKNFHPEGLYSTEIFGVTGTDVRSVRFGYIDLRIPIMHPLVFKSLGRLKSLYHDIMAGREFAVFDRSLKDFVKSNAIDGQTGYEFFMNHWQDLEFERRPSIKRQQLIDLIEQHGRSAVSPYVLVLPAGLRDMEQDDFGRDSSDEINGLYYKLIAIANTINPATVKVSPEAYNSQRMSLQNTFLQIFETLSLIIDGKHGLITGKWAARKIFNGTRNVITPMNTPTQYLGQEGVPGFNDTSIGVYQFMKGALPVVLHLLRTGFLSKVFQASGAPAKLVDPQTLKTTYAHLKPHEYDAWLTNEGLEKQISYFGESSIRNNPAMIGGHYLGLLYLSPDVDETSGFKTFKLFHGIDEIPDVLNGRKVELEHVRPVTIAEFFYISIYHRANDYPVLVTRYPVTGAGSVVESMVFLRSTLDTEIRVQLDDNWNVMQEKRYIAYQFPVLGSAFFNALSPHPSRLGGMGADHDGDTSSANIGYTDESMAEIKKAFRSRVAYIGGDGGLLHQLDIDPIKYVMQNLTGKI